MILNDFIIMIAASARTDRHRLAGTVYVDGSPAQKRIVVFKRNTTELVADTYSHPATGAWEIYGLAEFVERDLLVLALDETGNYNAEVADFVSQVTGV